MMSQRSMVKQVSSGVTVSAVNRQQGELFASAELTRKLFNSVPMPLLVINGDWQVVYANAAVMKMLAPAEHAPVHGLREGEAFHCIHGRTDGVGESPSPMCRVCGVAKAVAASLDGQGTVSDCRISCDMAGESHSLDLRAWAMPLAVGGATLSFLALADITHEKRRAVLENVCLHDLLNTLTGLRGLLDVLSHTDVAELPEVCRTLDQMTQHSIDEIGSLRFLTQAEESSLQIVWEEMQTGEFLHGTLQTLRSHPAVRGKQLLLDQETPNISFRSDRCLLRRVVDNLLLNALEATPEGGTVTLGCTLTANQVDIWVHNDTWMPPEVQLQVFQRSFSTKGQGRGIGTYSIRLLSTHLLGTVNFSSTPEGGTTFHVTLPQQPVL
jgi:nitrogen-specific signal transduction histidine kinase